MGEIETKRYAFGATVIVVLICLAWFFRYSVAPAGAGGNSGGPYYVKLDRWTGATYLCVNAGCGPATH